MQSSHFLRFALIALTASCTESEIAHLKGAKVYRLPTTSMEPTIARHEHVIADDLPSAGEVSRNAIVVHQNPVDGKTKMIHRIVGLPGETIEIRNKELFVNGQSAREPFVVHRDAMTYTLS